MGVPKLFTVINKNNVTYSAIVENLDKQIDVDNFFIDFNSIVHVTSQIFIIDINEIFLILLSLKSNNELKQNESIKKIVKKYNPYLNDFFNNFSFTEQIYDEFNKYFSIDSVDNIVINLCKDNVHHLIKKFVKRKLKLLYIAIDGVPSKSKMIEQKKRRYMGAIVSEYKKFLIRKHTDDLKNSKTMYGSNRLLYEKNKISFNKSKISPGTKFMDKLTRVLEKEPYDCIQYILSSINEIGEGEKKIIDYIKKYNLFKCMIYSPDADMILLTSLLDGKGNTILRHNQQKSTLDDTFYDLIDIDIFKKNIYDYLDNKSVNQNIFIKDMICLASVFGNDFIPKIESIDVQYNFEQLLDIYLATFKFFDNI
jgi:5'-3' exonuclease